MNAQQNTGGGDPATERAIGGDEPLAPYTTHERSAIIQVLRRLEHSSMPISAQLHSSDRLVLTSVIEVDPGADRLMLDYGPDEQVNRQLLRTGRAMVSADEEGVRIVFPVTELRVLERDDGPVFASSLPPWLARIQRRRFFRLATSSDRSIRCRLDDPEAGTAHYQVLDLSVGGLALLEPDADAVATWEPGRILRNVTLEAGEFGEYPLNLEICHSQQRAGARRGKGCIGCRFFDLPGHTAARLERFIRDRERAQLAHTTHHRRLL